MGQEHLNNLMVHHVHKDQTDCLNPIDVANDYVKESEQRLTFLENLRKNLHCTTWKFNYHKLLLSS